MFCGGVQIHEGGSKSASRYGPGGSKSASGFGPGGSKSAVTPAMKSPSILEKLNVKLRKNAKSILFSANTKHPF